MPERIETVLCFSHLRWDFVYQRPQHVMTRFAANHNVFYYEEPQFGAARSALSLRTERGVTIATPQVPTGLSYAASLGVQRDLLNDFLGAQDLVDPLLWYYTPMALEFNRHLEGVRVYDCMDQLAAFRNAPANLQELERELLANSALVFTGGRSLYYAKRRLHATVHCFPSAVDAKHFAPAQRPEPSDLGSAPHPRLIFYGVLDERIDVEFLRTLARELSDWQLILIGPTAKIDPAILPRLQNVYYAGLRPYEALPAYLEHCDVALLPFALNEATRYISPTKTLEYLAARKPVISTPIADVVDPYGTQGVVHIAATAREAAALARRFVSKPPSAAWQRAVDRLLRSASWEATVGLMERLVADARSAKLEAAG